MPPMTLDTLTIVGVGLIGGSIGLAARRRGVARRVLGVGRKRKPSSGPWRCAHRRGSLDLAAAVGQADLAVFCTPVDHIAEQVLAAAPLLQAGDAAHRRRQHQGGHRASGSTGICRPASPSSAAIRWPARRSAAPNTPTPTCSRPLTVVTPTPRTDPAAVERTAAFWQALGSRIRLMDPEEHDRALALTSHLPHLLASALAGILPAELRELTATGFRDTTRSRGRRSGALDRHFRPEPRRAAGRPEPSSRAGWPSSARRSSRRGIGACDALLAQAKRVRDALGS